MCWYKHLPWMPLLVGQYCCKFCSTRGIRLHYSGLSKTCQVCTLAVRPIPEVPVPYSAEMAPIPYTYSAVTFWDASSRIVWTTDADGKVKHSPNMQTHNQAQTTCSPEKPREASPVKESIWAVPTKITNKLVSRHFPSTAS